MRDQDQVWPVRVIRRSDAVRPLPPHARSLADLTFEVGDVGLSLSDYMARRRTAGLDDGRLRRALASLRPGSILDLLCTLPRAQPQGIIFNYSPLRPDPAS